MEIVQQWHTSTSAALVLWKPEARANELCLAPDRLLHRLQLALGLWVEWRRTGHEPRRERQRPSSYCICALSAVAIQTGCIIRASQAARCGSRVRKNMAGLHIAY